MTINRRDLLRGGGIAAAVAAGGIAAAGDAAAQPQTPRLPTKWDHEADVVVVGSGASGFPAAIRARENGSSVIIVEAQPHTGGHGTCSGGNVPLGGGTSRQKKYGIEDSPDLVFRDLTDWSVVEGNGFPDYRYNDREVIRAFADHSPIVFEWLVAQGVVFVDKPPDSFGAHSTGNSAPRENHAAVMDWPMVQTGGPAPADQQATTFSGNGLIRPLEARAAKVGVQMLIEHRMIGLHRQAPKSGRVLGIVADNNGKLVNIRARKGVILATGGSSTNVNFRRMFDPRLTEEYCGIAGQPWSDQDASGELAAMEIGASLWGGFNETGEFGSGLTKPGHIGTQYGYVNLTWQPTSKVFDKARATGLQVKDWQDVILVNMIGKRFYDETAPQYDSNTYKSLDPYDPWSWRNVQHVKFNPRNWINAALAGIGDAHNGGGPIWAIFDADAVAREKWDTTTTHVDTTGFFFSGNTLAELASNIKMKYQRVPMPAQNLEETVARYNGFVDKGVDDDFAKPKPLWKIAKPPFFAAWSTPVIHDTRVGLRINGKGQVMDMNGAVIAGLYSCGETAGGFSQHGLARATCQGYIAGENAAEEKISS
ncbi:MAG TPA: FAD-dependent oxidoreductase [Stellaceae bacterium]|jgi:succinate dehydrogenase/fumarate reductase flavoprotein subunit|nr:FAD-dependent oxidoreductase [Stellaceae bacterium]